MQLLIEEVKNGFTIQAIKSQEDVEVYVYPTKEDLMAGIKGLL